MSDNDIEILITQPKQVELTYAERILRDQFVDAYMIDYDAYAAAVRIGYGPIYAKDYSARFMEEAYTLNRIALKEKAFNAKGTPEEIETSKDEMKQKIMAGLVRESNYRGPGCSQAARVAALAKLASMYGMDAPSRSQTEVTVTPGAGTFVVPGLMTPEQWEAAAAAQQDKLVNGAKVS